MTYYSALHWAKKAEKHAEHVEEIKKELDMSGLDLTTYAKDAKVVHNTGDETIDGVKTFNSNVNFNSPVSFVQNTTNGQNVYKDVNYIRDKSLETNNIPYNKTYYTNALMDKNNKFVTYIQNTHTANGTSSILISARTQNANGENVTSSIGVEATKNGDVFATAPRPTASSSMDSKQISTVGWVNDPTKSTNVVHRSGDETIDGIKKFTNVPYLSINGFREIIDIDKGTAPTSGIYAFDSVFYDKNGTLQKNKIAQKYTYIQRNGAVANITSVLKPESGSEEAISMGIGYNEKGEGYSTTVMPVASSSTTATNIATVGWVNDPSASLNVVHRSGDETIEGKKTFKSSLGALYVRFTGSDSMTAPSSERYNAAIRCEDKNGKNTGNFRNLFLTNGNITTDMQVCREINGTAKFANLGIRMSNTGVVSTLAPTPPTGDNSTQIATTEWVNTTLTTAISKFVKGGNNYIKIPVAGKTNPLIIQWGTEEKGADKNVTFPTPFTTTNYTVTMNTCEGSGEQYARGAKNRTTTGFQMYAGGGATTHSFSWMAVGY